MLKESCKIDNAHLKSAIKFDQKKMGSYYWPIKDITDKKIENGIPYYHAEWIGNWLQEFEVPTKFKHRVNALDSDQQKQKI